MRCGHWIRRFLVDSRHPRAQGGNRVQERRATRTLLEKLGRDGVAFEHPVGRQSRLPSPRYWYRSASDCVRQTLNEALARQ